MAPRSSLNAGLAGMVARYRAHNDGIAARYGVTPPDPVTALLHEAQDHLERSRRGADERRLGALQDAIRTLISAVDRARAAEAVSR